MFSATNYNDLPKKRVFIDVRSPSEFLEGTIENAYNIPLFSDEERSEVGYLYKNESPDSAKLKGIEIISKKLPDLYKEILNIKLSCNCCVVLFCARGGYRSRSIATLLNAIGDRVFLLENGYKGYRNHVIEYTKELVSKKTFIVLHGNTGIGKTRILDSLSKLEFSILDLEGAANHRGSILGGIGKEKCSTQKNFEAFIYHRLEETQSNYVFIEAESRKIGNVFIPDYLFLKMKEGIHISLTSNLEFRSTVILDDYIVDENFEMEFIKALSYLEKYLGTEKSKEYEQLIKEKNFKFVAMDLMENYYDPMYEHTAKKYDYSYELEVESIEGATLDISNWFLKTLEKAQP